MIRLLDLPRQTAPIRKEIEAAIARVLDHGQFILGPEVQALEEQFAAHAGTRFAISCASGSDALLLPLMALGAGPGDKVITASYTFFATAGSIAHLGATPVFLDNDAETYNLDPQQMRDYLEARSAAEIRSIKAIIPVHLFGQCAEMPAINEIAARFGIPVIEDAAQAIGAKYEGRSAGTLGWCAAFSFFPTKNLGGFGDGGIITTDDAALAEKLRILRVHGSAPKYHHHLVGINSRLDTIQAAILLVKLQHLDEWTGRRRAHAARYRGLFESWLPERVGLPAERAHLKHVYNQFTIRVPHRDEVRRRLSDAGISSEVYYPIPLHLQECFAKLGYKAGDLPRSEKAAAEALALPIGPELTSEEIERVAEQVAGILSGL